MISYGIITYEYMVIITEMVQMKRAGEQLNIKGHYGGLNPSTCKFIYGPTDIEGHLGMDNRYYVLDFARAFPPTVEEDIQSTFLYKLFRPEFIKNYRIPLSSDAFSKFGKLNRAENNKEVKEASEHLFKVVIPEFALELEKMYADKVDVESQLTELVHRAGINVRYLGLVRKNLSSRYHDLQLIILNEMCARAIKNRLKFVVFLFQFIKYYYVNRPLAFQNKTKPFH
jgi:hypothetical protein